MAPALVVLILTALAMPSAAAAQGSVGASDTWQGAEVLPPNVQRLQNNASYTHAGEPWSPGSGITCPQAGADSQIQQTFWYRVIGTGGRIVLSTQSSDFDTVIGLYGPNSQPSNATAILCSDDVRGAAAELSFTSVAGATYYTQWGGCGGSTRCGASSGTLYHTALTNDQREFAAPAVDGTHTNVGATLEPSGEVSSCGSTPMGRTVWFSWQAPAKGRVTFDVGRFDTVTSVYRGSSGAPAACNDDAGGDVLRSVVGVDVAQGEQLFLQVGGAQTTSYLAEGNFSLRVLFDEDVDLDDDSFPRRPNGPDCDDRNANIRPGAADIPHNGIDEDCNDRDNLDGDGDGQDRRPAGADCDDGNHAIHVGASEVAGNFVDENCDGRAPAARLDPSPEVSYGNVAQLRGRRFGVLIVRRVAPSYRIRVRCVGSRSCPRREFRKTARSGRPIRTAKFRKTLMPGARVEIRVTLAGQNRYGYYKRYAVRGVRDLTVRTCLMRPRGGRLMRCRTG